MTVTRGQLLRAGVLTVSHVRTYSSPGLAESTLHGRHVAVIGAGPHCDQIGPVAGDYDTAIVLNSAAASPAFEWAREHCRTVLCSHLDDAGDRWAPDSCDGLITTRQCSLYRGATLPMIIMPAMPYLRPLGSAAAVVWLARLFGARSATLLCCSSVAGGCGNPRHHPGRRPRYLEHQARALWIAGDMPCVHLFPEQSVELPVCTTAFYP